MAGEELSDQTIGAIRRAVADELDHRSRVDAETHYLHHQAWQEWIECRQKRREVALAVIKHVLGWSTVLGVGWIGQAIWSAFAAAAKSHGVNQ